MSVGGLSSAGRSAAWLDPHVRPPFLHAGCGWLKCCSCTRRRMLQARLFMPIPALARAGPMVRTMAPSLSLACAPKTCLTRTRTRTVDLARLLPPGLLGQLLAPLALAVNAAGQPLGLQFGFDLRRPMDGVRPDTGAGVALRQQFIHHLAVMHRSVSGIAALHQLVLPIHMYMVPPAVMWLIVVVGPVWAQTHSGISAPAIVGALAHWFRRGDGLRTPAAGSGTLVLPQNQGA